MPEPHRPRQVPIAIVGAGALMPGSSDVAGFWRTVVHGRDLITDVPPTHWLVEDYHDPDPSAPDRTYGRRGAFLSPVDFPALTYGVPPNTLEATDTSQLLALMVADQVLTDATGGDLAGLDRDRVGVMLGTGALELLYSMSNRLQRPVWLKALREHGVPEPDAQAICERIADHYVPWQEATFPGLLSNVVAGRIANKFDLHGTNHTADAACASSLAALSSAVNELALGKADMAIAGGVDTLNDIVMYMCFSKTPALSPTGDCRPFSDEADGTILGEGLVMVALKRLADAERDGDRIYAVLRGIGSASDGRATAVYAPLPEGQARAVRRAYESAGYGPDTVELVEAHGTGTKAGDLAEYTGLRAVLADTGRQDGPWCALGSVKSQIGHTKSAAGAAGLLKAALALHHRVLPPTIKVDRPNPKLDLGSGPLYLNTETRPWIRDSAHPRRAAVSSFGFGGSNFHLTLEEYVPGEGTGARRPPLMRTVPSELVLLAADSQEALLEEAEQLATDESDLATTAFGSQLAFDPARAHRLAVTAESTADLASRLRQAAALLAKEPRVAFSTPTGIHYATGPAEPGRVAFLFSGQGSQYVGMGADVTVHIPQAQAVWDRAADLEVGDRPLHRVVFPPPAFDDADRAAQQALLTETEWAQPALAVQSLALLSVLDAVGVRPDCLAGHSFGELTALHAAGVFDADTLVRMARRRGELMRDAAAVPGAMLAVAASREDIEAALAGDMDSAGLWPANHNSPRQTVISGNEEAIEGAARKLAAAGLTAKRLSAATGFHSPLVAPASEPFLDFLSEVPLTEPELEVYGNSDAQPYPSDPDEIRHRIADHLARPVRFAEQIEAMYRAGVRTFVEVGAGAVLTRLVGEILDGRPHLAVSLDAKGRHGMTSLHDALGRLALQGVEVDFAALWAPYAIDDNTRAETGRRPQMTTPIQGSNHGRPYPPAGGAAELPPPNPVPTPTPAPTPAVAAVAPAAHPVVAAQQQTAEAHARYQEQAAEAHATYQRLMAESHLAFLRAFEDSYGGGPYPDPPTVTAAPTLSAVPSMPAAPFVPVAPAAAPVALVAPPPVPEPVAPEPPATPPTVDLEDLLLSIVADKTGYPVEMLASDMDLEADLGVDSIKRVQILSALRAEAPDLPAVETSELGFLRTVGDIVGKLREGGDPATVQDAPPRPAVTTPLVHHAVRTVLVPASGLETPGLDGGLLVVTDDGQGIAAHVAARLNAHGLWATVAAEVPSDAYGVVFLGGLCDPATPDEALDLHREAFRIARSLAPRFENGPGVFVTVQDTGGDFGTGGRAGVRAWSGGLAALTRTAAREWPRASVKAIDCERGDRTPEAVAEAVVRELLTGGDTLDVGLRADGTRLTVHEVEVPAADAASTTVGPDSVIVATGGARGVTAASLLALARAHQPRIALLGRSPLDDEPAELRAATDELALKRAVMERVRRENGSPADVPATVAAVLAAREVRATIAALEAAGSKVRHLTVDVRDEAAVAAALDEVRKEWGPVTGIVHGAGVLADKRLGDKTDAQFDQVFDTKARGLRALLAATADDPLDTLCVFSSVAARYGNAGQSDYAMANEVLNQVTYAERAARPDFRVSAIAWGPWQGGMVGPELEERFRSQGVEPIPVEAGAEAFVRLFTDPGPDTQVVVAGRGAADAFAGPTRRASNAAIRLTGDSHPCLLDHAIAGTPVLPLAMALEWLTGAAGAGSALRNVNVLRRVALDDLHGAGHRLAVQRREDGSLRLLGETGTAHYGADSAELTAPGTWSAPTDLRPSDRAEIYDGHVLFHGPRFQALRSIEGISPAGASGTLAGLRELGWDADRPWPTWWTDPAVTDGGLQLAVLWAESTLGGAALPMSAAEYRVHRTGPATGPVRCVVRARDVRDEGALCDIGFLDEDGSVRAELLGVSLVLRPS
ncbi:SDR family oxidoreductase [Streptomyces sp. NPDC047043]|uniref:SDR family oxidoreductase n=1 Tax=Streptomyces sp. NPDC047043 TaxID=3154497 RepID=UPI0033F3BFF6